MVFLSGLHIILMRFHTVFKIYQSAHEPKLRFYSYLIVAADHKAAMACKLFSAYASVIESKNDIFKKRRIKSYLE